MTASSTSLDETKMGAAAVGIAIALALRETDPALPERAYQKAVELHRGMRFRGEDAAADILLYFSRGLLDHTLESPEAA
jgi:hypothetical protein